MIVQTHASGRLLLITQPEHARLSAALVSGWHLDGFHAGISRETVLRAIAEHDNGWREIDGRPRRNPDTSRPYDFMSMPLDAKQAIWPRGVRRLAADSPACAALVAQHGLTVHGHRRGDPEWREFFDEMDGLRDDLLAVLGARDGDAREAFDRNYDLLYLGDVFSLVFCNRWLDALDVRGYRVTLSGDDLLVSPDPFDGRTVPFEVMARAIPDRCYGSDEDLDAAWRASAAVTLRGAARGATRAAGASLTPTSRL